MWEDYPQIMNFLMIMQVVPCSEASVERLFSFLHRTVGHFLRKSLSIDTLQHIANVYINKIIEI